MKLNRLSFAFGYSFKNGDVSTPNWQYALGQGAGHKITENDDMNEMLRGMTYSVVSTSYVSYEKGRGGEAILGSTPGSPIVSAAVFNKVYANETLISNGKFILLIIKERSGAHQGRFQFKFAPSNTYNDGSVSFSNRDFYVLLKQQLGLANDACWFVTDINIRNQDELVLKTYIVNKDGPVEYESKEALHAAWGVIDPYSHPIKTGDNIILYGVPGCGKSWTIKDEYCNNESVMERVVFHPDYTYSDFIGQILPESKEGHISYPFSPGPFTRILEKAWSDPDTNYYLIIEELNRGNAPAIFGEVFQLLDRKDGESEYGINNIDIAKVVYNDPNHPVKIPKNLFILATMNTADQNVFTLDTAFKRRWRMRSIPNDVSKCSYQNNKVCGTDVSWAEFLDTINKRIVADSEDSIGSEDKRLGAFFLQESELSNLDLFSEKVLLYLWNDVYKYDHKIFKSKYKTLENLIEGFKKDKLEVFDGLFNSGSLSEQQNGMN